MDRYFKLRQMFSDYLDTKSMDPTKLAPPPQVVFNPMLSKLTDEEKKRLTCKKITEEEAESFDVHPHSRPVLCLEPVFELRWYNKPDQFNGKFSSMEEDLSKLAQRLLTFFLKTELLESATFKYDDIRAIRVYFMDDREMVTERLLSIFDNIFGTAMIKLGHFSDKISVTVDYELRAFMNDQKKAKRLVLETMLKYPEYIPDSWGGESAILKWKEMKEADVRRREADAKELADIEKREREEKNKKEEDRMKKEEKRMEDERTKKEKEKVEKEERIKKEVEDAERKKKEDKEKRKKEVKKEKEEKKVSTTRTEKKPDDKEAKKKKEEKKKKKAKKNNTETRTREMSHEEVISVPAPPPPPQSPSPNQGPSRNLPSAAPRKGLSVNGLTNFLSGKKRREASAEKAEMPSNASSDGGKANTEAATKKGAFWGGKKK